MTPVPVCAGAVGRRPPPPPPPPPPPRGPAGVSSGGQHPNPFHGRISSCSVSIWTRFFRPPCAWHYSRASRQDTTTEHRATDPAATPWPTPPPPRGGGVGTSSRQEVEAAGAGARRSHGPSLRGLVSSNPQSFRPKLCRRQVHGWEISGQEQRASGDCECFEMYVCYGLGTRTVAFLMAAVSHPHSQLSCSLGDRQQPPPPSRLPHPPP